MRTWEVGQLRVGARERGEQRGEHERPDALRKRLGAVQRALDCALPAACSMSGAAAPGSRRILFNLRRIRSRRQPQHCTWKAALMQRVARQSVWEGCGGAPAQSRARGWT